MTLRRDCARRRFPVAAAAWIVAALAGAPARASEASVGGPDLDWSGPWAGVLASAGRVGAAGGLGGFAFGYAAQFDRIVVGVDGDLSAGSLDGRRLGGRYDVEAFGAIRARVGYAFGRFVAYGAAGVAFAPAEFARGGAQDRVWQSGFTVGAGVDVAIATNLSARAEYLYIDLDRRGFDAGGDAAIGSSGSLARLGLNYRF